MISGINYATGIVDMFYPSNSPHCAILDSYSPSGNVHCFPLVKCNDKVELRVVRVSGAVPFLRYYHHLETVAAAIGTNIQPSSHHTRIDLQSGILVR